jgi:membrane protein YqaA with SNARE-associated domain
MSSGPPLPGVLASLAPVLDNWGYLAVGGLLLIEDFGIPVPGETVLIAASVYAGAGRLNVVAVGVIALAAAVIGDNIGYLIGRVGGQRLINRFGRYVLLTPARVAKAEAFFTRHGGQIVAVARFIDGLRQANGIIAGLTGMPWRPVPGVQRPRRRAVGGHLGRARGSGRGAHRHHLFGDHQRRPVRARRGWRRDRRARRAAPAAPPPRRAARV